MRIHVGLVDADSADDFRTKLLTVKELWNSKEQQYLPIGVVPTFYDYIQWVDKKSGPPL